MAQTNQVNKQTLGLCYDVVPNYKPTKTTCCRFLGTSACGNGFFYCANEGHVPARIKTSRVNDGVCDPDCCDGSEEYSGLAECPNVCEEVGAVAKQERARLQLIQQEGSKLRKDYIDFGKAAKAKMVLDLAQFQAQTEDVERAVEEAKSKRNQA